MIRTMHTIAGDAIERSLPHIDNIDQIYWNHAQWMLVGSEQGLSIQAQYFCDFLTDIPQQVDEKLIKKLLISMHAHLNAAGHILWLGELQLNDENPITAAAATLHTRFKGG